ncbi:MAG: 50S ribosomal protein L3 [Melioribacteraceae bacterium]|nr:50S ribosomal protein L3 [Melioribacteraceae bacterium]MCF8354664.1 50S ribosomal protein L3 [Melioribacteraceae bacterium]MCF8393566.1 50S ribosomal protein L3 [Melioribacteraceae bacterium]MCF8419376.1 50S ribosomal protein L3 [Melioribacteraceae bacterium]
MPGLLGKKIGMTSIYTEDGRLVPVTVLEAGPCQVVDIKTEKRDGYSALKLGYGIRKEKHANKPQIEQYKKAGVDLPVKVKEFKSFDAAEFKIGDKILADLFKEGETVRVVGKSKGKGFQGVMRRHGFHGVGGRTHGQSDRERAPGSIGQSSYPSRVFKGTKMAGRMGQRQFTTGKLRVMRVIPDKNVILVKGAVPGSINSLVEIIK